MGIFYPSLVNLVFIHISLVFTDNMVNSIILIALATFPPIQGFWFGGQTPFWNDLKTTWAFDGFIPFYHGKGYNPLPRTKSDAINRKWVSASHSCENEGHFFGYRYIDMGDPSHPDTTVSPIMDKNGIIAGVQMNIKFSEAKANPNNTYKFDEISMFYRNKINEDDVYSLTAYFVDPKTICTEGRTQGQLDTNGTGSQLYLQNGPTPSNLIIVPNNRAVALKEGWSNNNCFVGMGVHNWFEQEKFQETECNYMRPVFLLYDLKDRLIGFAFHHVGKSKSNRYELPPASATKIIVGKNVSQCLLDLSADGGIGVTTMHVFFIAKPQLQNCLV